MRASISTYSVTLSALYIGAARRARYEKNLICFRNCQRGVYRGNHKIKDVGPIRNSGFNSQILFLSPSNQSEEETLLNTYYNGKTATMLNIRINGDNC